MAENPGPDEFNTEWTPGLELGGVSSTMTGAGGGIGTLPPALRYQSVDDDDVEDIDVRRGEDPYGYCYYRRPDGWVSVGLADRHNQESYAEKGMECLLDLCGRFWLSPPLRTGPGGVIQPQWTPYPDRPFDKLLLAPGGPAVFPVDQIQQLHWHDGYRALEYEYLADGRVRRHLRRIHFPQLDSRQLVDFACEVCGQKFVSDKARHQHVAAAHPEQGTLMHLAETQRAIGEAIAGAQSGTTGNDAFAAALTSLSQIVQQQGEMLATFMKPASGGDDPPDASPEQKPISEKQRAHLARLHELRASGQNPEQEE